MTLSPSPSLSSSFFQSSSNFAGFASRRFSTRRRDLDDPDRDARPVDSHDNSTRMYVARSPSFSRLERESDRRGVVAVDA